LEYGHRALTHLSELMAAVVLPSGRLPRGHVERLSSHARRAWRAAGRAATEANAERTGSPIPFRIVRALSRLHSDIGLIGRTVHRSLSPAAAEAMAGALEQLSTEFHTLTGGAREAMMHRGPVPTLSRIDAALALAPRPDQSLETAALTQILGVFRADLADFLALLEQEQTARAA
jgi:hypothetical protein